MEQSKPSAADPPNSPRPINRASGNRSHSVKASIIGATVMISRAPAAKANAVVVKERQTSMTTTAPAAVDRFQE
jgi:hypothetical protein